MSQGRNLRGFKVSIGPNIWVGMSLELCKWGGGGGLNIKALSGKGGKTGYGIYLGPEMRQLFSSHVEMLDAVLVPFWNLHSNRRAVNKLMLYTCSSVFCLFIYKGSNFVPVLHKVASFLAVLH